KWKNGGGNEATKKRKKNLLKQQYGNFKAEGSETLEQMFNKLQVIRNRNDLDTMSLDDLYNHLKVYEAAMKMATLHMLPLLALSFPLDINQIDEDDMEEMDIK
nr:hypothetical protein [Tanacetum cinerariifolium]